MAPAARPGACATAARTRPVAASLPEVQAMLQSLCRSSGSRPSAARRCRSARLVDHGGAYAGPAGGIAAARNTRRQPCPWPTCPHMAYAGLHGSTGQQAQDLPPDAQPCDTKPAAYNGRKLLHSVGRKRLPVRSGDLDDHFRLVQRHNRKSAPGMNITRPMPAFWKAVERTDSIGRGLTHEIERLNARRLAKRCNHPLPIFSEVVLAVSGAHRQRFKRKRVFGVDLR